MSFAQDARIEVINSLCENECCKMAQLSAIIHSAGELNIKNGKMCVVVKTDMQNIYNIINDALRRLYGEYAELTLDEDLNINKSIRYIITIPENCSNQVLFDCGLAKYNTEGNLELIAGIDDHIIESPCCALSYIKGVFITSVTTNIIINDELKNPTRTFSGYHLEFVFSSEIFADDFSSLLFSQGITSKKSKRKHLFLLYIKEGEQVSDLLASVGAYKSVLKLQNEITLRQMRNNINRQNNCQSANISKTVMAGIKQLKAIEKIKKYYGIHNLPENLQELCLLRIANPDESLENLTKLSGGKITKSGINHNFRKIYKIADEIEEEDEE